MTNYNLTALDDKEFESLAVDLIGATIGSRIERFKPGKDGGVDGRWFMAGTDEAILQCKHWVRTGFAALLKHMQKTEKAKLDRLKPCRYLLVTSVELSRHNKQSLFKLLSPYILNETDIYGSEDLCDLLNKTPTVEERHYKLWLTSTSAIGHIFNNAIVGRSHFVAERIVEKLPLIVKTTDFDNASKILANRHVVIVTGVPGIGKTTLAEQLLVKSLAEGFALVSIEEDVSEAEAVYSKDRQQVFYFDDFLGRNILEALNPKFDSHIIRFINRVRHDKTKRFVLTSRSNILNQAKHLSDLFELEKVDNNEFEIRIEKLSRLEKARILYSHVWHSALRDDKLAELFKEKRYKSIADHRNFNPRLISFVTDNDKAGMLEPSEYWKYVSDTLERPQGIWAHFFSGQLNQDCRDLVYLVVLNGRPILESVLLSAFQQLRTRETHKSAVEYAALVSLKVCVGSVLNRKVDARSKSVEYELYNPSVADYVLGAIRQWDAYREFFVVLRTVSSLRTLAQLVRSKHIAEEECREVLSAISESEQRRADSELDRYSVELCDMLVDYELMKSSFRDIIRRIANNIEFSQCAGSEDKLITLTIMCLRDGLIDEPLECVSELVEYLSDWPLHIEEFALLGRLVNEYSGSGSEAVREIARNCVKTFWSEYVEDFVGEEGLLKDLYSSEDFPTALKELTEVVGTALWKTGIDFSESDIQQICVKVDLDKVVDRNIEGSDGYDGPSTTAPLEKEVEDQMIDDLFDRDWAD